MATVPQHKKSVSSKPQQPLSQAQKLQLMIEKAVERKLLEFADQVLPEILNEVLTQFFPDQAQIAQTAETISQLQEALSVFQRMGMNFNGMQQPSVGQGFRAIRNAQRQPGNYGKYGERGMQQQIRETYQNAHVDLDDSDIVGNPGMGNFMPQQPMMQTPAAQMGGINPLDLVEDTQMSADEMMTMNSDMMQGQMMMHQQMGGMPQQMPMNYGMQQPMMNNGYNNNGGYGMQHHMGGGISEAAANPVDAAQYMRERATQFANPDPQEIMNGYHQFEQKVEARMQQQQQPNQ